MSRPSTTKLISADYLQGALRPTRRAVPATPAPPATGQGRGLCAKEWKRHIHRDCYRGHYPLCSASSSIDCSRHYAIRSRYNSHATGHVGRRGLATVSNGGGDDCEEVGEREVVGPEDGPLKEYNSRVRQGRLRDDPYQRGECFLFFLLHGEKG